MPTDGARAPDIGATGRVDDCYASRLHETVSRPGGISWWGSGPVGSATRSTGPPPWAWSTDYWRARHCDA